MKRKLNEAISYYVEPAYGSVNSKKLVMALAVDKKSKKPLRGIIRIITKRKGNVDIPGFVDMSKLILVESSDGLKWKKVKDLKINGIDKVIKKFSKKNNYFIGLEDPDAKNITFASDFVQDKKILYAHVDDSFIRAYEIDAKELKKLLPKKI